MIQNIISQIIKNYSMEESVIKKRLKLYNVNSKKTFELVKSDYRNLTLRLDFFIQPIDIIAEWEDFLSRVKKGEWLIDDKREETDLIKLYKSLFIIKLEKDLENIRNKTVKSEKLKKQIFLLKREKTNLCKTLNKNFEVI